MDSDQQTGNSADIILDDHGNGWDHMRNRSSDKPSRRGQAARSGS